MFSMDTHFHFQISLFVIILALFIFQVNNDLDLNLQYFININAIENNNDLANRYNISDPSEYFEDNVSQNNTKHSQIKNTKNEVYFSEVERFQQNSNNNKLSSKTVNKSTFITANVSSNFNFVAVGDWDCTGETEDTVDNIIDKDPEIVLALGDLSYNGKAKCWFEIIEPIAEKTKIAIGNHELDSSKKLRLYGIF